MLIDNAIASLAVRVGDEVSAFGVASRVVRAGVTAHKDGTVTPIVVLSDGRRITGEAAYYVGA
jgi:hypothetical protein